ncbi:hypothetical protein ADUPG1_006896 [Aduncisulcus paluster]|uniref:Uncharacterized protein n=1 Tax=Aduncisulcus paluster TaxID=2918883 RepID=A0ABQ5KJZ6_9EUKA|nr:hypothetical protein ADUPG1_006896 [Aduncisulcus paluster]
MSFYGSIFAYTTGIKPIFMSSSESPEVGPSFVINMDKYKHKHAKEMQIDGKKLKKTKSRIVPSRTNSRLSSVPTASPSSLPLDQSMIKNDWIGNMLEISRWMYVAGAAESAARKARMDGCCTANANIFSAAVAHGTSMKAKSLEEHAELVHQIKHLCERELVQDDEDLEETIAKISSDCEKMAKVMDCAIFQPVALKDDTREEETTESGQTFEDIIAFEKSKIETPGDSPLGLEIDVYSVPQELREAEDALEGLERAFGVKGLKTGSNTALASAAVEFALKDDTREEETTESGQTFEDIIAFEKSKIETPGDSPLGLEIDVYSVPQELREAEDALEGLERAFGVKGLKTGSNTALASAAVECIKVTQSIQPILSDIAKDVSEIKSIEMSIAQQKRQSK